MIWSVQEKFEVFDLSHLPKSGNMHTDSLATLATSSTQDLPRVVLVEDLFTPTSIRYGMPRIHQIKLGPSWMDFISLFLEKDILPEEKSEAEKVQRNAPRFWLSEDRKLYKRSFSGLYLLYVHPEASESLLEELHEGIYGSHTGGDPCLIGLLPKDIGRQACKRKRRNTLKNAISVKGLCPIFTSLEEFSTFFLALGHLLNRAWTLWDLSLKR